MKKFYHPNRRARMYGADCCPTCGQKTQVPAQIFLQEADWLVIRGDVVAKLIKAEFLILRALLDAWPRSVEVGEFVDLVWDGDLPEWSRSNRDPYIPIRVYISQLRRKVAPIGLVIPYGSKAGTYCIAIESWGDQPVVGKTQSKGPRRANGGISLCGR